MTIATGADRGRGSTGSNTYHASFPEPPELTRTSPWRYADPPGPDRGWRGWVAAVTTSGCGGRVCGDGLGAALAVPALVRPLPITAKAATTIAARRRWLTSTARRS